MKSNAYLLLILVSVAFLIAPRIQAQDTKENAEFKLAIGLYNDGMFDLAVSQLKNFIDAYPNTTQGIEARFYLGETQLKLKHYDDARITFQNFALTYVDHPKSPEAWMRVAEAFLDEQNEREAAAAFERVKVFHPKSPLVPEALLRAGQLFRRLGDREDAKKNFRSVIQDYSTSTSVLAARLAISEMYAEEGQTELAEREAKGVAESDAPAEVRASALFSLGKLHVLNGLFGSAESVFVSILQTYKNTPAAIASHYELGLLAMGEHNYASALDHLKRVASDNSADDSLRAEAMFRIGEVDMQMRAFGEAQKSFEQVTARYPHHTLCDRAYLQAGIAALDNHDAPLALQYARKLTAGNNSLLQSDALLLSAHAATAAKQYNDAMQYYSSFIASHPNDPPSAEVLMELAELCRYQMHDFRKAISAYDQIAQRYARSSLVVNALIGTAECQLALGDPDGAIKTYKDLEAQYPGNDAFERVQKAITFLQDHELKNRDAGISKLARLMGEVLTEKSKAALSLKLGEIYFNDLKDYESAAQQFELAISGGLDEKDLVQASFLRARSYDLLSDVDSSVFSKAIGAYVAFLREFPSQSLAGEAAYREYLLHSRGATQQQRAALASTFLNEHAGSIYRERVLADLAASAADVSDTATALRSISVFLAEFPESSLTARMLDLRGAIFLRMHQPDSAVASWDRLLALYPDSPPAVTALANLGMTSMEQHRLPQAIAYWEHLTSDFFYTDAAQKAKNFLVDAYTASGQSDEAISLIRALGDSESTPETFYSLAVAYEKKGDRQKAVHYYIQYLLHDRRGAEAGRCFYALGGLARTQGRTDLAAIYFKEAAALGGTSNATRDIADLLFQTEQYNEAARQYALLAKSADSSSQKEYLQERVIVSTLRMNKLAEAKQLIEQFQKAYGKQPATEAEFEYEIGSSYYQRQDYSNARKAFEKVSDDYKRTKFGPWGRYYIGKIAEVSNKLPDAAKIYESILNDTPSSDVLPRVLLSLGNMHFNAERYEEAIHYYQQITSDPEKAGDVLSYAMNNLIEAYESTRAYDAALKMTREYIERFPNDENIIDKKIKLGTLYTKLGYYDQAVLYFQNLINEAGSLLEAELRYDVGDAYYQKGDYQQAILEFLKVPYLVSRQGKVNWTATSFYMAGQSYEKMSKFEEAIGMYQQIIDRPGIDATFKAAAKKEIDRVRTVIKGSSR